LLSESGVRFLLGSDGDDTLRLKGRSICSGKGKGELVLLDRPFSFLGGVEPSTGILTSSSGQQGRCISAQVFGFPRGRGSTVGSYTILQMRKEGTLPAAIINERAETIVATGAVMAGVPMMDAIDLSLLRDGDQLQFDAGLGEITVEGVDESPVVTCLLMHEGRILVLKRSQEVSTNRGLWAGVSGYIEEGESPLETALKEIREEASINEPRLLKAGGMQSVRSEDRVWHVHPFLFESPTDEVRIDWEHTEYRWIVPGEAEALQLVPGFARILRSLMG